MDIQSLDNRSESIPEIFGKVNVDTYSDMEQFLWESLLIFSLRSGFINASSHISRAMMHKNRLQSCLLYWCTASQSRYLMQLLESGQSSEFISSRLEMLASNASQLAAKFGEKNSYFSPLTKYANNANKLIIHFSLENGPPYDWAELILNLNRKFHPLFKDTDVQDFRFRFSKLLCDPEETARYLKDTWLPQRQAALRTLTIFAKEVASCLPRTIFDVIGSSDHLWFDTAVRSIGSNLSTSILKILSGKQVCTEADLISIADQSETTCETELNSSS